MRRESTGQGDVDSACARNPLVRGFEFDHIDICGRMDAGGLFALRKVLDGRIGEDTANGEDGGQVGDSVSEVEGGWEGETIEEAERGGSCGE